MYAPFRPALGLAILDCRWVDNKSCASVAAYEVTIQCIGLDLSDVSAQGSIHWHIYSISLDAEVRTRCHRSSPARNSAVAAI